MSLPKLNDNLNKVSSLPEKPTLTSAELQAVFDEAGNIIKDYLNNTLTGAIETLITTTVNANKTVVENTLTSTSITSALASAQGKVLNERITTVASGKQKIIDKGTEVPSGGEDGDIYIQYFE
jgi:N-methylhydantoinase B/oxoprolinase/acetone carboxylase alpha subunit